MGRLDERVIIVTGGAQGIGLAYCKGLAAEGAKVVVADIDRAGSEAAVGVLGESGADALAVVGDVSKPEDTEEMARAAIERFGRIDGLINNAAMFQRPAMSRVPFDEIPVDEWDRLMAINLRGIFLSCRAVVAGTANLLHYVTSKAGVIGLTRGLARELGEHNITVNAIAPGLTISMEESNDVRSGMNEQRIQARSLKRAETPEDLVGAAVFLCSSDSDFMSGQTVVVDGGLQMH